MNGRLTAYQIGTLCIYSIGMALGQLLFKAAAIRLGTSGSIIDRLVQLLHNWLFLLAAAIYVALSVLWVWVLSFTPLSRAYPFVALAFALTPIMASIVFGEPLNTRIMIGIFIILGGLVVVAG